jgi:hypothetical protein
MKFRIGSALTRATRRNIPEDATLHSHRRENLKSYLEAIDRILWNFVLGHGMWPWRWQAEGTSVVRQWYSLRRYTCNCRAEAFVGVAGCSTSPKEITNLYATPILGTAFTWPCHLFSSRTRLIQPIPTFFTIYRLHNIDRLCRLVVRAPGYKSRGRGFDSLHYRMLWEVVGLERGAHSLVKITEELLEGKSIGSDLEKRH